MVDNRLTSTYLPPQVLLKGRPKQLGQEMLEFMAWLELLRHPLHMQLLRYEIIGCYLDIKSDGRPGKICFVVLSSS